MTCFFFSKIVLVLFENFLHLLSYANVTLISLVVCIRPLMTLQVRGLQVRVT